MDAVATAAIKALIRSLIGSGESAIHVLNIVGAILDAYEGVNLDPHSEDAIIEAIENV